MVMHRVACPSCRRVIDILVDDKKKEIKKVKGPTAYYPLMKQEGELEWSYGYNNGLSAICKCGAPLYLPGSLDEGSPPGVTTELPEGYSTPGFCDLCGRAFVSTGMICPYCSAEKGGAR